MIVRQSTARTILVGPVLDSTGAAKTDEVVASIKVTKNGTVGAADGSATLTHDHAGKYKLALTANDSDTVGVLEISLNSGTNDMPVKACNVVETAIWDALFADGATGLLPANMTQIGGDTQSATDLKDFADAGYDPSTNKVQGVVLVDTMAGTIQTLDALDTEQDIEHDATQAAIAGIGTAGGAAINVDASADNSAGGITGVTSGTTKVGTETGTFANTSNVNLVYHQITHDANDIDWVYQFLTGGGTSVVEARWVGYISGSNDTITFYAWDHVGGSWEAIGTQVGAAFTTNVTKNLTLYSRHRGTSAAELGKVYIRLACTGMTSPILYTDQLFVSFAITSRSVGYSNVGAVSIDTLTGVAGTESFVNGVADNPVSTLADALTIATAVNLRQFEIGNGSSITLANATQNKVFEGHEWTLALGGQDITSSTFINANVSGTGTGTAAEFETCEIGTVTLGPSYFHGCGFSGTMTLGAAGDYFFYDCHSSVAGTSTPVFDLATAGANNMSFRRWSGGITLNNISSNDVISIDAVSGGTITLNGADGDVQIRGMCSSIVDNRTGTPTLGKNAVINQTLISTPVNLPTIPTVNEIADGVWDEATAGHTTAGTYGGRIMRSTNSNVEVLITGSNHIAADVHEFQTAVIEAAAFAANSLTAAALAADFVTEIQNGLATSVEVAAAKAILDKVDSGLVIDGLVYQFTANMLELGPSGGGGATLAKQEEILAAIQGSEVIQVASPNVLGNLVLTQGDSYDGIANPKAQWTVTTDYTDGWTVTLTIRDEDDVVIYTTAGTVVSSTVIAVAIAAPTGLTMAGCPGQWQGKFDVQLTKAGSKKTIALGTCYINEDQTR